MARFIHWIQSSLRRRTAFLIVIIMTILLGIFVVYDIETQRYFTEEALHTKGKTMAMNGALAASHILEDAITSGRLTEEQIFDTQYVLIEGTDPPKYHTAYDYFTDQNMLAIEDGYLLDPDIVAAVIVDINGYLPTHNSIYSQPLTGDPKTDLVNNRTKRIFNDATGLAAARNTQPYLHQTYYRDTGEILWDISAPIMVNGLHWGAFRILFSLENAKAELTFTSMRVGFAALLMVLGIAIASYFVTKPITLVNELSQIANRVALGDVSEQAHIKRLDELGVLATSFNHIVTYHRRITDAAERISNGDLSVEVTPKSKEDALSIAFAKMVANLGQNIKALEKEQTLMKALLDHSADMIYFKDLEGRFIRISQSQASRFGISDARYAEGKSDFDFFAEDHARQAYADEQHIIQSGEPLIDKGEREIWPDGHQTWVATTKMPFRNEDGEIIGTIGISRDITEHMLMEAKLKNNQENMVEEIRQRKIIQELLYTEKEILNTTLMSISEGVITTDKEGFVTFINQAATEIIGYSDAEVLDHSLEIVFRLLLPDSWHVSTHIIEQLYEMNYLLKESQNYWTATLLTKMSDKKLIDGQIAPILGTDDSISGHVLVFQDITQKQKQETQSALSQKMESIGQLASGIAHEINTPIQYVGDNLRYLSRSFFKFVDAITVYRQWLHEHVDHSYTQQDLEQMEGQTDPRKVNLYIKEIPNAIEESLAGVERVRKIVLAMREFSHPSQKEKKLADINHGIETTVTISRNEWKYIAELDLELDPDLPLVNCQIDEINQVILNMIVNSSQAIQEVVDQSPGQKGRISIRTINKNDWICIIITDTGNGIPDTIKDRVFDPFFTTKGVGKGTGQGLYLAHNIIVNKHNGCISVESEAGKGTTFIIELPVNRQEQKDD